MKKLALVFALLMLLMPFSAPAAQATPITLILEAGASVDSLTTLLTIADGDALDMSSAPDIVEFIGMVGTYDFSVTTGASIPEVGELARLNLYSMNVHQLSGPGVLRVTLYDTYTGNGAGYSGGALASANALMELIAPPDSTISLQSWVNTSALVPPIPPNTVPLGSTPLYPGGVLLTVLEGETSAATQADSAAALTLGGGDLSLFTQITVTFSGVGSTSITDANAAVSPATTPEPASLFLIGSGAVGLATVVRRRNKRSRTVA